MSSRLHTKDKHEHTAAFCPRFHHAVELVGKRWTGAIVRVLLAGPRRFNELLAAVPGLSDRLLAERLKELEREGLVLREVEPGPPVRVAYALTPAGEELDAALAALGAWAERWVRLDDEPRRRGRGA